MATKSSNSFQSTYEKGKSNAEMESNLVNSKMNFTQLIRVTSGQLHWSPNGEMCAIAITARLEIRKGSKLSCLTIFNCSEYIQSVEWSLDSTLVYTANFKRGIVEVWQPHDPSWKCKIDEGAVGLIKLCWSPDSRHILTTAEFHLRVTVWSLISKTVYYIKCPKDATPGLQFSFDGDYLAVAERADCKDTISIYETKSWTRVKNFEVATRDLSGLCWSPDDLVLAVWDSPVEYKVLVYTITGHCLTSYSAYQWALGIKCVTWSPSSQFLAVGSYDEDVRFINDITWKMLFKFSHSATITDEECVIYHETERPLTGYPATLASAHGLPLCLDKKYEVEKTRPVNLAQIPAEVGKKANPKVGISVIDFNWDGRFFATRVDNMPATVWIWNVAKLSLVTVLVHSNPVRDMKWCPKRTCLAMCTGGNQLYMWTPFGSFSVAVPTAPNFQVVSLKWRPTGFSIALIGKEEFSVCYLNSNSKEDKSDSEEF